MRVWRLNPLQRNCLSGFFHLLARRTLLAVFVILEVSQALANGHRPAPEVREADFSGKSYLSVEDVAEAMKGHLHWYPVSQRVDLSFQTHNVQFFMGSNQAVIDGQPVRIASVPIHDERGLWVAGSFFQNGPLARAFQRRIDFPVPKAVPEAGKPVTPMTSVVQPVIPELTPHAIQRIVIDPGHGGKDPGTVGASGTEEKAVNLWLAQELADALREKDYEVLLTRTDDSFIPLAERAALANHYHADLFISLHCNASLSSRLSGFEVYFLSEKTSDPHANAVARMENASLALEGKTPPSSVQAVLRSLMKNANINKASQLGAIIERSVARQLSQNDRGVKQAGFYVLRDAHMPAVLIEIGFLSNREEERRLQDAHYRDRMVRAIEKGILEYDRRHAEKSRT